MTQPAAGTVATVPAPAQQAGPPGNQPGEVEAMYHKAVTGKVAPPDDKITLPRLKSLVNRFGSQAKAARAMGVGRSTLSGWLAKKSRPSPISQDKISNLQRKVREQDAAEATYGKRAARLQSAGATLRIDGTGGPQCTSPEDALRDRDLGIALSGAEAQQLMALMAANDPRAMDYIDSLFADKYMHSSQSWEWTYIGQLDFEF